MSGYCSGLVEAKSHTSCWVNPSCCGCTPSRSSYGMYMAPAAFRQPAISSGATPSRSASAG